MELPPEMRTTIYEMVFAGTVVHPTFPKEMTNEESFRMLLWARHRQMAHTTRNGESLIPNERRSPPPGLLLCSKQIYSEASSVYYHRCTLRFTGASIGLDVLCWLQYLQPARLAVLTNVHLNLHGRGLHAHDQEGQNCRGSAKLAVGLEFLAEHGVALPAGILKCDGTSRMSPEAVDMDDWARSKSSASSPSD